MDLLCDNVVVEILRRLPAKYLHRVRAVATRYNLIVLSAGFVARFWESHGGHFSGVFIQSHHPWRQRSRFLASPVCPPATDSIIASDFAYLPQPPPGPAARSREIFVVHATAGLLLCSRSEYMAVHYYVCNPVTCKWVALPKLPWPPAYLSGLLSVTNNNGDGISCFQVVLFNHPRFWSMFIGECMELKVFSSATGRWVERRIQPLAEWIGVEPYALPFLGQSGTAYWMGQTPMDRLITYNCLNHTIKVLPVPSRVHGTTQALNRRIGEHHGGGLRYAHFDCSVFQVWDGQTDAAASDIAWNLVHQVGVMELAERNPEATGLVTKPKYVECRIKANSLFSVLGFHPTDDIIFLDVNGIIGAYSMEHGTTTYQCSHPYLHHDVFPYVHPGHPVEIPAIKKEPLELKPS